MGQLLLHVLKSEPLFLNFWFTIPLKCLFKFVFHFFAAQQEEGEIPYFLDYLAPFISLCPQIGRAVNHAVPYYSCPQIGCSAATPFIKTIFHSLIIIACVLICVQGLNIIVCAFAWVYVVCSIASDGRRRSLGWTSDFISRSVLEFTVQLKHLHDEATIEDKWYLHLVTNLN